VKNGKYYSNILLAQPVHHNDKLLVVPGQDYPKYLQIVKKNNALSAK